MHLSLSFIQISLFLSCLLRYYSSSVCVCVCDFKFKNPNLVILFHNSHFSSLLLFLFYMKISFSSSHSSTSSSTSNFDGDLCNSHQNDTAGCLSGILRRLLCTSNLRTHPFDCIKEETNRVEPDLQKDLKIEATATPGLVARLMGLDSVPESNLVHSRRILDSIGRSRSVNSVDYWSEFDPTQFQHRQVRSSLSFREVPTFLQKENDDFLLLSFENVCKSEKLELKGRKSDMGSRELKEKKNKESRREQRVSDQERNKKDSKKDEFLNFSFENLVETKELGSKGRNLETGSRELKQRRKDLRKNKESRRDQRVLDVKKEDQGRNKRDFSKNENLEKRDSNRPCRSEIKRMGSISPQNKCDPSKPKNPLKPTKHKEVSNGAKPAKKKILQDCSSENSSPISVLDLDEFLIEPKTHLPEEESRLMGLNSRRKLCPDLAISANPSSQTSGISIAEIRELRSINDNITESTKAGNHNQDCLEMWGELCKLGEEDMKTSNWIQREMWKMEDLEEIGIGFELQIVDRLLQEFVAELAGFPM